MGLLGLAATFLPKEILVYSGLEGNGAAPLAIQLCGALYLSFAMLNWMGRTNIIGGIYSRPVAMGNTLHFTMGALALLKGVSAGVTGVPVLAVFACYSIFAVSFGIVLFSHPAKQGSGSS